MPGVRLSSGVFPDKSGKLLILASEADSEGLQLSEPVFYAFVAKV